MYSKPKYGEIWLVDFEPQVGSEILKTRPAVIVSIDSIGSLPVRIIVPIRDCKPEHLEKFFYIPIDPDKKNGLSKTSSIDCSQIKSFDIKRFKKRLGKLSKDQLEELTLVIIRLIGYIPPKNDI